MAKLSTLIQPPKEPLIDKTLSYCSPQSRHHLPPSAQTPPANPSHRSAVGRGTTLDSSSLSLTAPLFDAAKQPGSGEAPLLQASRSPLGSYPNTLSAQKLPFQLHQSLGSGLGTTLGPAGGLSAQPFASSLSFPASPKKGGLLLPPTTTVAQGLASTISTAPGFRSNVPPPQTVHVAPELALAATMASTLAEVPGLVSTTTMASGLSLTTTTMVSELVSTTATVTPGLVSTGTMDPPLCFNLPLPTSTIAPSTTAIAQGNLSPLTVVPFLKSTTAIPLMTMARGFLTQPTKSKAAQNPVFVTSQVTEKVPNSPPALRSDHLSTVTSALTFFTTAAKEESTFKPLFVLSSVFQNNASLSTSPKASGLLGGTNSVLPQPLFGTQLHLGQSPIKPPTSPTTCTFEVSYHSCIQPPGRPSVGGPLSGLAQGATCISSVTSVSSSVPKSSDTCTSTRDALPLPMSVGPNNFLEHLVGSNKAKPEPAAAKDRLAPMQSNGLAPVSSGVFTSVPSDVFAPVSTVRLAPVSTGGLASVSTGGLAPVFTGGLAPVSTGGLAPVSTGGLAPVSTGGLAPVSTGGLAPVSTGGLAPVSTEEHASFQKELFTVGSSGSFGVTVRKFRSLNNSGIGKSLGGSKPPPFAAPPIPVQINVEAELPNAPKPMTAVVSRGIRLANDIQPSIVEDAKSSLVTTSVTDESGDPLCTASRSVAATHVQLPDLSTEKIESGLSSGQAKVLISESANISLVSLLEPKGSWLCGNCYLRNQPEAIICLTCKTVKSDSERLLQQSPFMQPQSSSQFSSSHFKTLTFTQPTSNVLPIFTSSSKISLGVSQLASFTFSPPSQVKPLSAPFVLGKTQVDFTSSLDIQPVVQLKMPNISEMQPQSLEEEDDRMPNEEADIHFDAIIKLPDKVAVSSLEEEEEVLFSQRSKLYRSDSNQWKEIGTGDIKILKHKATNKVRVLMRRDQTLKICCNHYIHHTMTLQRDVNSDSSWLWFTNNCSDEQAKPEKLCVKFNLLDSAQQFKAIFEKYASLAAPQSSVESDNCLVENELDKIECVACCAKTPEISSLSSGPVSSSEHAKDSVKKLVPLNSSTRAWTCEECLEENNVANIRCISCFASRPAREIHLHVFEPELVTVREAPVVSNIQDDDCVIISVDEPSAAQMERAKKYTLSLTFYLYENKSDCSGCRGCMDEMGKEIKSADTEPLATTLPKELASLESPASSSSSKPLISPSAWSLHPFSTTTSLSTQSKPPFPTIASFLAQSKPLVLTATSLFSVPQSGLSFADLAKSNGQGFSFKMAPRNIKPFFAIEKVEEGDRSDNLARATDLHFKPVVTLPPELSSISNGEEEEHVSFSHRAKLYRFDTNIKQWKELGVGDIKILCHKKTGKARILMRSDQVLTICCNHYISGGMDIKAHGSNDPCTLTWFTPADFADGDGTKCQKLMVRFKHSEIANLFKSVIMTFVPKCSPALDSCTSGKFDQGLEHPSSSSHSSATHLWACNTCYVENTMDRTKCIACSTSKPVTTLSSVDTTNVPVSGSASSSRGLLLKTVTPKWTCDTCYLENTVENSKCIACNAPRSITASSGQKHTVPNLGTGVEQLLPSIDVVSQAGMKSSLIPQGGLVAQKSGIELPNYKLTSLFETPLTGSGGFHFSQGLPTLKAPIIKSEQPSVGGFGGMWLESLAAGRGVQLGSLPSSDKNLSSAANLKVLPHEVSVIYTKNVCMSDY